MTPEDQSRADQIRARAKAARVVLKDVRRWLVDANFRARICDAIDSTTKDVPWLLDRLAAATERADKAEAAVERIGALHQREEQPDSDHFYCDPHDCDRAGEGELVGVCRTCRELWPCPTSAALFPAEEAPSV